MEVTETRYVGTAEAAEIPGVEVPRNTRWRRSGRMPPAVKELAATPVWRREDVEILAKHGEWKVSHTRSGRPPKEKPFNGTGEAAEHIGEILGRKVDKSQIGRWRRAGVFPEPSFRLQATPVWEDKALNAFVASRPVKAA